jgi:mannose-6-phosphate isomerase-like protein (cupin superfamily)
MSHRGHKGHEGDEDQELEERMRKMIVIVLAVVAGGAAVLGGALLAQGVPPAAAPSTYKSAAEINAALDKADINSKTGGAITIAKGVVVRRRGAGSPQYAIIHPRTMEMYQIIDGSATLVTGGTLTPPLTDNGPDIFRSMAITGGKTQKVGKGDVVVTPPGTPHWFSQIDGAITYFEATYEVK